MPEETIKRCPFCAEEIRIEAIKCKHCGSLLGERDQKAQPPPPWYRSRADKMIAGVCMGLAKQFNVSVTAVRLAFVLATCIGGWGIAMYIVLWFIMPLEPFRLSENNTPQSPKNRTSTIL
jgi:phage shock protein C